MLHSLYLHMLEAQAVCCTILPCTFKNINPVCLCVHQPLCVPCKLCSTLRTYHLASYAAGCTPITYTKCDLFNYVHVCVCVCACVCVYVCVCVQVFVSSKLRVYTQMHVPHNAPVASVRWFLPAACPLCAASFCPGSMSAPTLAVHSRPLQRALARKKVSSVCTSGYV